MAKRLTDTEMWDQDWFVELPPKYKLFWCYIKDKCDSAGFWRPNKVVAQRIIGEPINIQEFVDFINSDKQRVIVLPSGKWFIRDFFIFQYGEIYSPDSPVHKGALKILSTNGVHIKDILNDGSGKLQTLTIQEIKTLAYSKGSVSLREAFGKAPERDKDKDKDKA